MNSIVAISLVTLFALTTANDCSYSDACNQNLISAPRNGVLVDSCRSMWRVDQHCTLSFLASTDSWMKQLRKYKLHQLAIPGSHDASAYKLKYPTVPPAAKWAITQSSTILTQLRSGVRFLDIRLRREGAKVMTAHRYYMVPFKVVSKDIRTFINENPSEIVLVSLTNERSADKDETYSPLQIKKIARQHFGKRMRFGYTGQKIRALTKNKKNIIVNPQSTAKWLNVQYGGQLCSRLRGILRGSTLLNVYGLAITPNTNTIVNGLLIGTHDSIRSVTAAAKPAVMWPFIDSRTAPAYTTGSKSNAVYTTDFVDLVTSAKIISLNHLSRSQSAFTCVKPSCATDSDCPTEAPVCRNAINAGAGRYTCEPRRPLGAQCSENTSCASGNCFAILGVVGTCQCKKCVGNGCGGCPSGSFCPGSHVLEANSCSAWNPNLKGNGQACDNSGQCISKCCSYTFLGTDTCEENTVVRTCT